MQETIFKSYDIRGIYNEEFNREDVKLIARAYLQELVRMTHQRLPEAKIVVARDMRTSSEDITTIFIQEVIKYGVEVHDIGLAPIEALYFSLGKNNYTGGVMITASHNPPKYGGIKMLSRGVEAISGHRIKELLDHDLAKLDWHDGQVKQIDIWEEYIANVLNYAELPNIKPLKIVVDAGNGMAGVVIPRLFAHLPQVELIPMFFELDGNFPHHSPNPLAEGATELLSAKVKEIGADLGAIFDADADRLFLVDEKGALVRGDQTLMLLAEKILKYNPGAGIVYNVFCSQSVPEKILSLGGHPIRSKIGWKNIKENLMQNQGAILGGEVSGHFSFQKNYFSDEAFGALFMILEILSEQNQKLSALVAANAKYHRGDEINLTVKSVSAVLDQVRSTYHDHIRDELDGITVEFWHPDGKLDWWFCVRGSNTEPLLRMVVETANPSDLNVREQELKDLVDSVEQKA